MSWWQLLLVGPFLLAMIVSAIGLVIALSLVAIFRVRAELALRHADKENRCRREQLDWWLHEYEKRSGDRP
jgi:uncharacterized membrane protein YciS (DUF1049 family)